MSEHYIIGGDVSRIEVNIPDEEMPDWEDRLWGTWLPNARGSSDGGYWLVCGDNTGAQNLIVHPYALDALIDLLQALKAATPEGAS